MFTFGKYKGQPLWAAIEGDPQYIQWLLDNTDFDISHSLVDELETAFRGWRP